MTSQGFYCPIGYRKCRTTCYQWTNEIRLPDGSVSGYVEDASCILKDDTRWKIMMGVASE